MFDWNSNLVGSHEEPKEGPFTRDMLDKCTIPGWRPISEAPRDTKRLRLLYLARFDSKGQLAALDFDGVWEWDDGDGWEHNNGGYFWASNGGIDEPTHWAYQDQPIPALSGEVRLWDSQWSTVVNTCKPAPSTYPSKHDIEDLVAEAVKMTERYIAENVKSGALPPARN